MKAKKILISLTEFNAGGVERALVDLLSQSVFDDCDITVCLVSSGGNWEAQIPRKVKIKQINFDRFLWKWAYAKKDKRSLKNYIGRAYRKFVAEIAGIPKMYQIALSHVEKDPNVYDVAIDFTGYGSITTAYIADKINARKKISWVHDEKMTWLENVKGWLSSYDYVVAVSQKCENIYMQQFGEYNRNVKVMYNFEQIKRIERLSDQTSDEIKKPSIVTVGRISHQKGIDIAISAAKILAEKNIEFYWYCIGEGPEMDLCKKMIGDYDLHDRVYLVGKKDNPYPYMNQADIYVQPSRHEGWGIAVDEAGIFGKKMIVSDLSAIQERYAEDKGVVCVPCKAEEVAKSVENALENPLTQEQEQVFAKLRKNSIESRNQKSNQVLRELLEV